MTQTYLRYFYSNDTTSQHEVSSRNRPVEIPNNVYAFEFYDQQKITAPDGEICYGAEKNHSCRTFVDCVKLTRSELEKIIDAMNENCENQVVISRFGHLYPCGEKDRFVTREQLTDF